ncbi:hypothetical protein CORC01_02058 [Colletotrichum orchidophilum]|uniref:Uncharacterized protein n=1 Tax=Colletotrichum orchidophilum TaxID=1209926 RepID=A0A1G4BMH3_9PEZI|nr:uncharacterized protein CORC01_02058 [Colletotrichum orchidophilum]OHF02662.1 hypothetical protein CORC01_02058 [Colletotrichum orchidophilum]
MKTKTKTAGPSEIKTDAPKLNRQERAVIMKLLGGVRSFTFNPLTSEESALVKATIPRLIKASKDPLMPDADRFFNDDSDNPTLFGDALRVIMQLKAWYGPTASH